LRFEGTGAEGDDFGDGDGFAFAEAYGFFDGELVEGVHAVFYAVGLDAGVGFVDAGFDLEETGGLIGCRLETKKIAWQASG